MRVLDRKLLRDVWRLKAQIGAIAMIVGAGIAVVVMSFGTMRSLADTRAAYYDRAQFADLFAHVKRAPRGLLPQLAELPGAAQIEARIVVDVRLELADLDATATARVVSLPADSQHGLNQVVVRQGQMPAPGAVDEALVSEAFALANGLAPGDRLDAIINGRKRSLTVSGFALSPEFIYALPPGQLMPDNRHFAILWMNEAALAAAFDLKGAFNDLVLRLGRGAREAELIAAVDRALERYGGGGAYPRSEQQSHAFVSSELDQLELIGRIIPPIFLGIAAFLLNMVIARLVDTERELIGLFKAFGYSDLAVAAHYLKFAFLVVLLGGALGLALGAWLGRQITELYANVYSFPFLFYRLDPSVLALAVLVSLAAGLGGAFLAVRRVALLPPSVAMAPPVPTRHRALLPAWVGRYGALDQISRMVIRHLVRYPLRAALTVTGIALAVGGLVSSLFALDSIEFLINQDFFRAQRQDLTLTFVEPRGLTALDAVAQLPGVLAAEPVRVAPARLVHGSRSRRAAITGTLVEAELSQVMDGPRGAMALPAEGLVLSRALANKLEVRRGEDVMVEILEGRRTRAFVPVVAIVEEYVGLSARMSLGALARLLGEAPTLSGAHLRLDRAREAEFNRAVKALPVVAGVADRARAVASFRAIVAENISTSLFIYFTFAGLIAFGVLYSNLRVTLSERGRELATLRVIGLTAAEAAYVLIGQMVLLALVALPLGCLIGYGLARAIAAGLETDLFRIPLVIERATYGVGMLTVVIAGAITIVIGVARVRRLDLIGVLKTRE